MDRKSSARLVSPLAAWALAFGCSVGWDATVMPWTTFLPTAGPLGTVLGLLAGGLAMAAIVWNYHYMINRHGGSGGVYSYAAEAFGYDHGFLCAWFLCLTYAAIVWSDATAMSIIVRYVFGDVFQFGFRYEVSGFEVCLGDVLVAAATAATVAFVCCRRRLSFRLQTILAFVFAAGFAACFAAAAWRHEGGLATMAPAFSPTGGSPVLQLLQVLAIAPWLFVGFEAISNTCDECSFSLRKSFGIMAAALVASVVAYAILTAIPALAPGAGCAGWTDAVAKMGEPNFHAFDAAKRSLGEAGPAIIYSTLAGAIFTNLIGNTIVASRLLAAMADDGGLPLWFGRRNADGAPKNAVYAIASLALFTAFLGQTVIDIILDTALVGASVAYAYTSAATFKLARREGAKRAQITGLVGLVVSVAMALIFILPIFSSNTMMATESYLVLVFWCIAGLVFFLFVFRYDDRHRFGRSSVVWLSTLAIILFMTVMWMRQATYETTEKAFGEIELRSAPAESAQPTKAMSESWRAELQVKLTSVNSSIMRNSLVQTGLIVLALALMFCLFSILRRRERELEQEKTKAKSYFFSTVSHDIRTPLNAIIGFSEMLKSGFKTEEERAQAIDSILVSGRTLLALINDVLDLSKLESGKMEIQPEPTDCPLLLRGVVDAFRASGGKPDVVLRCRVEPMPPLMLDPQRLRQIVFNLVGNAVKFTEKGHVELRSSFTKDSGGETGIFRLAVEDTGCGISEDDLKQIGSAYVQVGSSLSRNGGTGLGLAICRQLAAAMDGSLDVVSKLGEGSTFSIELNNVKPAPNSSLRKPEAKPATKTLSKGAQTTVHRILIVDDSKLNLMVLKALLKNAGDFEIEMAMDGREALNILEAPDARPFDLVLTDMWMPNLDGKGLVRAIRSNPAIASLRVVAVTADVESLGKSDELGFDDILLKPVTPEKFVKILAHQAEAGPKR
ncbi:MAG: amino acid permease [Kiritimatiellae bacterium]|nr:amino acid permease [Kiritimatiellia bacterium]